MTTHQLVLAIAVLIAVSATAQERSALPNFAEPQAPADRTWYKDSERGWFWYEDPPVEAAKEKSDDPEPTAAGRPAGPIAELEAFQAEVERAKALAVMRPTLENVTAYLKLNQEIQRRATLFADVTQRVVWQTPSLDNSLVRPHSKEGLAAWNQAKKQATHDTLREIAAEYGLFFIFSSDCPYCRQFAPFVKRFAQSYGFELKPITIDGDTLPEFPDARYAPAMASRLGVQMTPAVFLADPSSRQVHPIAYGIVSLTELEDRIIRLVRRTPGDMTYSVYAEGTTP